MGFFKYKKEKENHDNVFFVEGNVDYEIKEEKAEESKNNFEPQNPKKEKDNDENDSNKDIKNKKRKKVLISLILFLSLSLIFLVTFKFVFLKTRTPNNSIEIVDLPQDLKINTGQYLVTKNALYQKMISYAKDLKDTLEQYSNKTLDDSSFTSKVTEINKRLTYYYLISLQTVPTKATSEIDNEIDYSFYLSRRASEEILKYLQDGSSLRLEVANDLLNQCIEKEVSISGLIALNIAKYNIDPNTVAIDSTIWDKETEFLASTVDNVLFKDLNTTEVKDYNFYLKTVNESFMLLSWEFQNIYLNKIDFVNEKITQPQLVSSLNKSTYLIIDICEHLTMLKPPTGLEILDENVKDTVVLYRDALNEINKYKMTNDLKYYDNALKMLDKANEESGLIGEFIYNVRSQYSFK